MSSPQLSNRNLWFGRLLLAEHILLFPHWCLFAAVILSLQNDWLEFLGGRLKCNCQLPVGGKFEENSVWAMSCGKARKYTALWTDKFNEEEPKSASYVNDENKVGERVKRVQ